MRTDIAHFTLDGTPLCECQYHAYSDRLRDAGSPPCTDKLEKQLERLPRLLAVFPCRIALVHGDCKRDTDTE